MGNKVVIYYVHDSVLWSRYIDLIRQKLYYSHMYRGNSSRILPIVVVLIVVALGIAGLVSIGKAIFGGNSATSSQMDAGQRALLSTDSGSSVRMTVRGPIVATEDFRSYTISIDPTDRNLTTYSGYLNQPLSVNALTNNTAAYEQFVYSLSRANFMKDTVLTGSENDTRGICATGDVYTFDVLQNGVVVKELWTSTCQGSPGSFKESVEQVSSLFLSQIPNSAQLLQGLNI